MARPIRKYPVPKIQKRNQSYRIRWFAFDTWFEFSLGKVAKEEALRICLTLGAAFANRDGYPEETINEPAVKRYLALTNGLKPAQDDKMLITRYIKHMSAKSTSKWPLRVQYFLNKALKHIGALQVATTGQLLEFLDSVAHDISPASRNRAQTSLSGFYRWMTVSGHMPKGYRPMEGIKQVCEERNGDGIVIWERQELKKLLKQADNRKDGIAVWIAVLAGLRRSEIARLQWNDVTDAFIIIRKSKTKVKRQVPLSKMLAKRLEKEKNRTGRVVPWPEKIDSWQTAARRLVEKYLPTMLPDIHEKHPEKFGWNPFRHTFASRLAQSGLSLDIIAAWIGDSPKVCKEHYTQYVPKSMRDKRIDAVNIDL